ncbi:hypothetical protein [Sphingomonas xinjiangensis]|uniref:Uncharacterized protein n=1 Tax=Sphingomonas xinjiangensis TaxID=643568 RepID=A0A840YAN2_9SPHN|nr:hypothetical protein [Sphingomonas xinjiangensis]MBB5709355.1 hypothetical protein [Sphingomonas xinjiangensis]
MAADLDIEVPRNGDYCQGWWMEDQETGEPIDITGWTLGLSVRAVAGQGSVIASAAFRNRDDVAGYFEPLLSGQQFDGVPGANRIVRLAYDFRATDAEGIRVIETRGQIILHPGVTP